MDDTCDSAVVSLRREKQDIYKATWAPKTEQSERVGNKSHTSKRQRKFATSHPSALSLTCCGRGEGGAERKNGRTKGSGADILRQAFKRCEAVVSLSCRGVGYRGGIIKMRNTTAWCNKVRMVRVGARRGRAGGHFPSTKTPVDGFCKLI